MPRARIVCTLGPASSSLEVVEGMARAGMDVARLNFSHGTHELHRRLVEVIRRAETRVGKPIAILQDVQGPKLRLGRFAGGAAEVRAGDRVTVTTRRVLGNAKLLPTPIPSLPGDVRRGDHILLDDGRVQLEVWTTRGREVQCRVVVGGLLKDHKGLNFPGSAVSVPTLTKKDVVDLAFGQTLGVDYVALSFVRSARDVERARRHVKGRGTPLIAKIEKPQAVAHLAEIVEASDGVMIARGDLGVEMPLEQLPAIQKSSIRLANQRGALVIVATEMLESMVQNSRPTRAEVSDVANAILDGADAVMLSGETASGKHPVAAVRTMASIVAETERSEVPRFAAFSTTDDVSTGVAAAAVAAADRLASPLLVAYTESGFTARLISELRPRCPILALTPSVEVTRRTCLAWGVSARVVRRLRTTEQMVAEVRRMCLEERLVPRGSNVVLVCGAPNQPGNTNLMTVRRF